MKSTSDIEIWTSRLGIGLILMYCIFASVFTSSFAEIHVKPGFLPFPIFIGELLMLFCLPLMAWIVLKGKVFSAKTLTLFACYFGWVVVKALINYSQDGALTFRNAALFYYPVFALFGYCFYRKAKITRQFWLVLAFAVAAIIFFKWMFVWFWWTYILLLIIVLFNLRSNLWRWLGCIFLCIVVLFSAEYLYKGPRAHFVSVFCAVFFLAVYYGIVLFKRMKVAQLIILLGSFILFVLGFFIFANKNAVSSLISIKGICEAYELRDRLYQAKKDSYRDKPLQIVLYNPDQEEAAKRIKREHVDSNTPLVDLLEDKIQKVSQTSEIRQENVVPDTFQKEAVRQDQNVSEQDGKILVDIKQNKLLKNVLVSNLREDRDIEEDKGNIVFRLFIWRDMAIEMLQERAWWGFSFGHPQRSRSLEVLHWGESEWGRDGWITAHNSFFHIIYRAGILGALLIGVLFYLIAGLIKFFFSKSSMEGSFLVSGLIYWLVLSNFFVILELPYNAIVFWTLLGVSFAYRDVLREKIN